ncbi:hypothetical protein CGZ93_17145 [Enemella dayhoffiae]|uniref:Uncharacterized protein n=1 Tax=Enemella dayhoffiae TaxID=2016507 RepID=A0A255GRQ3_9ACTN|nr:hypothetical protein [Enemella dayhoffiae]OYO17286.1 hypothetical protein CGZ93_17145 [Enemella dayhoffiae]
MTNFLVGLAMSEDLNKTITAGDQKASPMILLPVAVNVLVAVVGWIQTPNGPARGQVDPPATPAPAPAAG